LSGPRLVSGECRGADAWAIHVAIREQRVDAAWTLGGPCLPAADVWLRSGGYPELVAQDLGACVHVVPGMLASNAEPQSLSISPEHICFRMPRHDHSVAYVYPRSIRISQLLYVCDV